MAINTFESQGRTGIIRTYHKKKVDVVEWKIDTTMEFWSKFWSFWRSHKNELKEMGFGACKEKHVDHYMLYCETKYIWEWFEHE